MRQFDVVPNPSKISSRTRPYLLILQSDLTNETRTVIAAPLTRHPAGAAVSKLFPIIEFDGVSYAIEMPEAGAIARSVLGRPIANLMDYRDRIVAALDVLFLGI
jgi:hypothetical protein